MIGEFRLAGSELVRRYALDTAAEWRRLFTHFEWRPGFAFIVLLVPDEYGAEICRLSLEEYLVHSNKKLLAFCYAQPELKNLAAHLTGLELPADAGAIWIEAVIPEAVKGYENWRDAWRVAIAVLNRYRNQLMRRFNVPLIFVGAPWLQVMLREIAPDLWSMRTLVVRIKPELRHEMKSEATIEREILSGARSLPDLIGEIEHELSSVVPSRPDLIDEDAPDPEFALEMADLLRGRAGQEPQRANLLHRAGKGYLARSQLKQAEKVLSEAIDLRRQFAPESNDLPDAIYYLSESLAWQNRYAEAVENLEESLRIYQRTGSVQGKAKCIRQLGNIALWRANYTMAREQYEQALPLYHEIDDIRGEADCIRRLGDVDRQGMDHMIAKERYEQALSLYRRAGDLHGEAKCIRRFGDVAFDLSDHVTAKERFEQALSLYHKAHDVWGEARCIRKLGDLALMRSEQMEARRNFETALALFVLLGEPFTVGTTHLRLARMAETESERNQHISAARAMWEPIDRPDLIRKLEREFGITA